MLHQQIKLSVGIERITLLPDGYIAWRK